MPKNLSGMKGSITEMAMSIFILSKITQSSCPYYYSILQRRRNIINTPVVFAVEAIIASAWKNLKI